MISTHIALLDIQSWWEIPCISHFCSLFSSAFDIPDFDIEDLESELLSDGTIETDYGTLIPELIVRLLQGCDLLRRAREEITHSNYQMFLRRLLRHQSRIDNTENLFDTDVDFQSLPVRKRLQILHSLCQLRLNSADVPIILSELDPDTLRVAPLGYDSKNSSYWYFYGTRLYREDRLDAETDASSVVKSNNCTGSANGCCGGGISIGCSCSSDTIWQVICFTEEDWQNLASKFKNSTCNQEQALYKLLEESFLPSINQLFRERENIRRRKLFQIRNSTRIRNILEEKARLKEAKKRRTKTLSPAEEAASAKLRNEKTRRQRRLGRQLKKN